MKPLFKNIESYQHYFAKVVLRNWLLTNNKLTPYNIVKIVIEREFCIGGFVYFKPDLTLYDHDGVKAFYEVTKTNPITLNKIDKMNEFSKIHKWNFNTYEIKASWIMDQTRIPNKLKIIRTINF